jgi:ribosomal protein S18 acetylase RimI-like enzyme
MVFRQATENDIDSLFRLSCLVHHQPPYDMLIPAHERERFLAAFQLGSSFEQTFKTKLRRLISSPNGHVFIADVDGEIAGYRAAEVGPHSLELHGLFVDERFRGQGIGKALFTAPLHLVPPGGTIHLTVLAGNTVARSLYESLGFQVVGSAEKTFYGAEQLRMQKVNTTD